MPRKKKEKKVVEETEEMEVEGEEQREEEEEETEEPKQVNDLFDALKGKGSITTLLDDWTKVYLGNKIKGMVQLINLLIKGSGCKVTITEKEYNTKGVEKILKELFSSEYVKEGEVEYPLISRKLKKFSGHFLDFWKKLVTKASNKILYDNFFMETITSWIASFSNEKTRPIRHTSTAAGLEITGALITILNRVSKDLDQNNRLIKTEQRKSSNGQKIASLTKRSEKLKENVEELSGFIDALYRQLFYLRYKDVVPEIRAICIEALGEWILSNQSYFLEDQYLKYVGWLLSDKDPKVRVKALEVVHSIYELPDITETMALFTDKFKPRVVEMVCDNSTEVGILALQVVTQFEKFGSLDDEDIKKVYQMITDDHRKIRLEAAKFVQQSYFDRLSSSLRSQKKAPIEEGAKHLISFVNDSLTPQLPNYIIDALWGKLATLTNWNALVEVLKDEEMSAQEHLDAARILIACVKKSVGISICPIPKGESDNVKEKDAEKVRQQHREEFTKVFMKELPDLLETFKDDPNVVLELSELPRHMLLEMYSSQRQKGHFNEMVKRLCELFKMNSKKEVLESIAGTLEYLSKEEHPSKSSAEESVVQLSSDLCKSIVPSGKSKKQQEGDLQVSLVRLDALYKKINFSSTIDVIEFVEEIVENDEKVEDISSALSILNTNLLWNLLQVVNDPDSVEVYVTKRNEFVKQLEKNLENENQTVAENAFLILCDLLVLFPREFTKTDFKDLFFNPTKTLEHRMKRFYEESVEESNKEANSEKIIKLTEAFARPLSKKSFESTSVASVLANFCDHGKYLETVVKQMMAKLRENSPQTEWENVYDALVIKYDRYLNAKREGDDTKSEEELSQFKALAARLSLMYSFNMGRQPELLNGSVRFVNRSIDLALKGGSGNDEDHDPTEYYPFLNEGVNRLISRMGSGNASSSLRHLKEVEKEVFGDVDETEESKEEWVSFRSHLERAGSGGPASPKKGKRSLKKVVKKLDLDAESGAEEENQPKKRGRKPKENGTKAKKAAKKSSSPVRKSPRKSGKKNYSDKIQQDEEDPIEDSEEEELAVRKKAKTSNNQKSSSASEKKRKTPDKEPKNGKASKKGRKSQEVEEEEEENQSEEEQSQKPKKGEKKNAKATAKKTKPKMTKLVESSDEENDSEEDEAMIRQKLFN
eukprot:TRINITY_DN6750_c0_g1_i1.p1 TRINITY_DN6750_c0_g1~~TRINITY_DN6750_c0_g1_i1.p1  ORF type:complete len:1165 (-),score=589.72 TRINITY_DN6750_c0_g1_i1:42-3536(-)